MTKAQEQPKSKNLNGIPKVGSRLSGPILFVFSLTRVTKYQHKRSLTSISKGVVCLLGKMAPTPLEI